MGIESAEDCRRRAGHVHNSCRSWREPKLPALCASVISPSSRFYVPLVVTLLRRNSCAVVNLASTGEVARESLKRNAF